MKKQVYSKPLLEEYLYLAEEGYATTIALHKDFVLIEGEDRATMRASDELTEYTEDGEYRNYEWNWDWYDVIY